MIREMKACLSVPDRCGDMMEKTPVDDLRKHGKTNPHPDGKRTEIQFKKT
jgi:hypothetical protein